MYRSSRNAGIVWARRVNSSWRVDETYVRVRGKWHYLYRAVGKHGKTVDFLLRADHGIAAAQAFFRKALTTNLPWWPRKVTLVREPVKSSSTEAATTGESKVEIRVSENLSVPQ